MRLPFIGSRRHDPDEVSEIEAVANIAERLGAIILAGVPSRTAWEHIDSDVQSTRNSGTDLVNPGTSRLVSCAAEAARDGESVSEALSEVAYSNRSQTPRKFRRWHAWRNRTSEDDAPTKALSLFAATWQVAEQSGAPLAGTLRDLAVSLRDEASVRRDIRVALAGPRASNRLVAALPIVAMGFGMLMGFDTVGVLFTTIQGWICLLAGSTLTFVGVRWTAAMVARATSATASSGFGLELLAIALSGGLPVDRARKITRDVLERLSLHGINIAGESILELARRAGVPAADLLRSEASRIRRVSRAAAEEKAAALGSKLLLPVGVCVLPAFILLGVLPLLISVVSQTFNAVI